MRPILIAAGRGKRLEHNTAEKPKTLVSVMGRPMLEWILEAFREAGFARRDVLCICGYKSDVLKAQYPEFTYVDNHDWERNNVLLSLMHAREHLRDGFVCSYADIVYERDTVKQLLSTDAVCTIACDTDWRRRYLERTNHPESDAEKVLVEGRSVVRLSREIPPQAASAEFIGVMKATEHGATELLEHFDAARQRYQGSVWREGRTFEKAYLIDLLQYAIERGFAIEASMLHGGYMEIDTVQDLELTPSWWKGREH